LFFHKIINLLRNKSQFESANIRNFLKLQSTRYFVSTRNRFYKFSLHLHLYSLFSSFDSHFNLKWEFRCHTSALNLKSEKRPRARRELNFTTAEKKISLSSQLISFNRRRKNKFFPSARNSSFTHQKMVFRAIFLLLSVVSSTDTVCEIEYLTHHNIINITTANNDSERVEDNCDAKIQTEITKFYEGIQSLITNGVGIENLDNSDFFTHEKCIMQNLRFFNVSDMFLKGIAYQKLGKVHKSDHSYNLRMTSVQILLLYALQVCDPRTFYKRNEEKIFSMNMRIDDDQAVCLLNHLNENNADEPYQFREKIESIVVAGDSAAKCHAIVKKFVKNYYYVLDRVRSFSVFNLNPAQAVKCRTFNDKSLIENIMLLTIFHRLNFTSHQMEVEEARFYEIAKGTAKSFFHCISMYD
jgi:hypothetical protein